jgi:1,4-dihydroxy-2-naphthoate octaprenyltransferase
MGTVKWMYVLIVLLGAVSAHVCVNAFNEYFDFKSGLDEKTAKTPFSGGSGTLPAQPRLVKLALAISLFSLFITAVVGIYFVYLRGILLLPIGIVGLFLLVAYTGWLTKNPFLCLIAPGLGFGVLMVNGTHFALSGSYSITSLIASLVPFFLVSNLLLLNQFPDVEADKSIGRKHFPITLGKKVSSIIFGLFLLFTYATIIAGVATMKLPVFCLLALLSMVIAGRAFLGALRNAENTPALIPSMGMNVTLNLATPALLAIGIFIG